MGNPTEINSVFWNEETKSWDHKMIKEKEEYDKRKEGDSDLIFNEKDNKKKESP